MTAVRSICSGRHTAHWKLASMLWLLNPSHGCLLGCPDLEHCCLGPKAKDAGLLDHSE